MFESKYSKVLTVILVIVIIAILALLGFLGYDMYQKYFIESEASAFVDNFEKEKENENEEQNQVADSNVTNPLDQLGETPGGTGNNVDNSKPTYKGFNMVGTMVIPATIDEIMLLYVKGEKQ